MWQIHVFDFRTMTRSEPFSQLLHSLYVYPLSVNLSRKKNLFIRVELRKDDVDIRRPPLEVCPFLCWIFCDLINEVIWWFKLLLGSLCIRGIQMQHFRNGLTLKLLSVLSLHASMTNLKYHSRLLWLLNIIFCLPFLMLTFKWNTKLQNL